MSASPSALRQLAARAGVLEEYVDVAGRTHSTSDATRAAILAALGHDIATTESCLAELEALPRAAPTGLPAASRCFTVEEALRGRKAFGLVANLWAVRSRRNWGIGDLTDLADLAAWAAAHGADFLGINPLHASRNEGYQVSPYAPLSRLFRNPLYLDVEAVPEHRETPELQVMLDDASFQLELAEVRGADRLDHARVWSLKRPVLDLLHRTFAGRHRGRGTDRGLAYDRYRARQDDLLLSFATFCALEERLAREGKRSWQSWPARFHDPSSAAVRRFREENPEEVDFHSWLQFELDRQLAAAAERARGAGMRLGLYPDLAVGSLGDGADPWMFPRLFVEGLGVGAPPDPLGPDGQDWGFPPVHPRRLAEDGFRYWEALLESSMAHAGLLRIDHALGLGRLFVIPRGRPASEGAYLRQPQEDLLRVLAQVSRRAKAVVVAEDLGTVPAGFEDVLARAGLLSTKVLYFERERGGGFAPSSRLSPRALVTANTHDLPPLLGWWQARDLELRRELDLLPGRVEWETAVAAREREKAALVERLRAEGTLEGDGGDPAQLVAAVHAMLARSRAPLVGLVLDDVLGETEPVNLPGVTQERWPSWTRRHRVSLEDLSQDAFALRALAGAAPRARLA